MEQTVRVRRVLENGNAEVFAIRESACSGDCHKCSGCGAAKETVILTASNPIGACAGDLVTVRSSSAAVLKAAAVLYLVPLVLFLAGYLVGEHLWAMGPLVSILALALGLGIVVAYDRHIARSQKVTYTITGFAGESLPNLTNKGDNEID